MTFWYVRMLEPQTLTLTGLTRDGVFLVEKGQVVGPVQNFRFNQSVPQIFVGSYHPGWRFLATPGRPALALLVFLQGLQVRRGLESRGPEPSFSKQDVAVFAERTQYLGSGHIARARRWDHRFDEQPRWWNDRLNTGGQFARRIAVRKTFQVTNFAA